MAMSQHPLSQAGTSTACQPADGCDRVQRCGRLPAFLRVGCFAGLAVLLAAGCANFVETRTIDHFMQALQEGDIDGVRHLASDSFEEKALRRTESLDDMKILQLPTGETTVVEVEDVSEDEKKVTVQAGESTRKLLYKLVRKPGSSEWVVDDIYMRQKRKGLQTSRSVSEQMDLLLSVREFLDAWDTGRRERVLGVTTEGLRTELDQLTNGQISWLSQRIVNQKNRSQKLKPEAQLDGDAAVVRLPRATGEMILSFRLNDGAWLVDDVAVEARETSEHIPSLRKTAAVLARATTFLRAFHSQDHKQLAAVCTDSLFKRSLAPADLNDVPLPPADAMDQDFQVTLADHRADVMVNGKQHVVTISMDRGNEDPAPGTTPDYRIEEVTLYELTSRQQMRLSALFTGRAIMQIAAQSLARGDLPMLQKISTADLNQRVWRKLEDRAPDGQIHAQLRVTDLPLARFVPRSAVPLRTEFLGDVTKYHMEAADGRQLVYILRDRSGDVRVDDILLTALDDGQTEADSPGGTATAEPSTAGELSLKAALQVLIPVRFVMKGLEQNDIPMIGRYTSADFNRLVWSQVRRIPAAGPRAVPYLRRELQDVRVLSSDESAVVALGSLTSGARVSIKKEQGNFVVDDILLTSGAQPEQQARLKSRLVDEMSWGGTLSGPTSDVQLVGQTTEQQGPFSGQRRTGDSRSPAAGQVTSADYTFIPQQHETPAASPRNTSPRSTVPRYTPGSDSLPPQDRSPHSPSSVHRPAGFLEPAADAFTPPPGVSPPALLPHSGHSMHIRPAPRPIDSREQLPRVDRSRFGSPAADTGYQGDRDSREVDRAGLGESSRSLESTGRRENSRASSRYAELDAGLETDVNPYDARGIDRDGAAEPAEEPLNGGPEETPAERLMRLRREAVERPQQFHSADVELEPRSARDRAAGIPPRRKPASPLAGLPPQASRYGSQLPYRTGIDALEEEMSEQEVRYTAELSAGSAPGSSAGAARRYTLLSPSSSRSGRMPSSSRDDSSLDDSDSGEDEAELSGSASRNSTITPYRRSVQSRATGSVR